MRIGTKLYSIFQTAGLAAPTMRLHAVIGGASALDEVHLDADQAAVLADDIVRLGLATATELGIETLVEHVIPTALWIDPCPLPTPSSTSAIASIRRAACASRLFAAAVRNSDAVNSVLVIATQPSAPPPALGRFEIVRFGNPPSESD